MMLKCSLICAQDAISDMLEVLSANPKIECISFDSSISRTNDVVDHRDIQQRFQHLRGFMVARNYSRGPLQLSHNIVAALRNQLESLHLVGRLQTVANHHTWNNRPASLSVP